MNEAMKRIIDDTNSAWGTDYSSIDNMFNSGYDAITLCAEAAENALNSQAYNDGDEEYELRATLAICNRIIYLIEGEEC